MSSKKLAGLDRRDFLKLSALVGAGLSLPKALNVLAQDAPSGTINYIHHFTSDNEFAGMERVMALFAEAYPDVEVIQENIPNADFMAKFTAAVLADARADATMIAATRLPDMLAMDGVVDLTDRVNNWELKQYFPDNRWEGVTIDDKIYGVPAFTFTSWMYYRKDWLEEAGYDSPPATLDEFVDVAIKMTNASENRYGFGMRAGDGGQEHIIAMIEAFGSPIVVDGEVALDRQKVTDAITFYSELASVHGVTPPSAVSDSAQQIRAAFRTGQTGMFWHHSGSLIEIQSALTEDQLGTAVMPAGPEAQVAYLSYLYNGLMKEDNADAAWAWVSFWGEAEPAIAFLEETGYFPASSVVAEDERITSAPLYRAAAETLRIGKLPPTFVGYDAWGRTVVLPAFQKIIINESTVEQAVDEMFAGLEDLLE